MRIRLATRGDGAACAAVSRPAVEASATSFELEAPDGAEMAARIESTLARTPWLVAEVDGVVAGYAYATRHRERPAYDWTAETTVYVAQGHHGRGVGRALMTALLDVLAMQGFHLAVAGVTLPNPASVGLHLAMGYRRVGTYQDIGWKMGEWWAVEWFARRVGTGDPVEAGAATTDAAPRAIRPLPEIRDDQELGRILARATARSGDGPRPTMRQGTRPRPPAA